MGFLRMTLIQIYEAIGSRDGKYSRKAGEDQEPRLQNGVHWCVVDLYLMDLYIA